MAGGEQRRGEVFAEERRGEVLVPWPATPMASQESRNLILIFIDDAPWFRMFQDVIWKFPEGPYTYAATPNLDALAAQGLRFRFFQASSVCSPSRASLLNGMFARVHGLGTVSRNDNSGSMGEFGDPGYVWPTWPQRLEAGGIETAVIGKLHLSLWEAEQNTATGLPGIGFRVLERIGFGHMHTTLRNLNQAPIAPTLCGNEKAATPNAGGHYQFNVLTDVAAAAGDWSAVEYRVDEDGDDEPYSTRYFFERAAEWVEARGEAPWCLYMPFPYAHTPPDGPPQDLVTTEAFREDGELPLGFFKRTQAATEAFDALLGEFLGRIPPEVLAVTTIMVLSDNGIDGSYLSNAQAVGVDMGPEWDALWAEHQNVAGGRVKSSQWRMGTYGQLLVAGPDVANRGAVTDALACVPDIAATVADHFGVPFLSQGISFWPVVRGEVDAEGHARKASVSEFFNPNGNHAAIVNAPAWSPLVTYDPGARVEHDAIYYLWTGLVPVTGLEPGTPGAGLWRQAGRYHARCEARLGGLVPASGGAAVSGIFSLVRRRSNDVDLYYDSLFRLADKGGVDVDRLELEPLDLVEFADHYQAMLLLFEGALELPHQSGLALRIRDRSGAASLLPTNEATGHLPLRQGSGVMRELEVLFGAVRYRRADGTVWSLDLVPFEVSGDWWAPLRRSDGTLRGLAAQAGGTEIALRRKDGTLSKVLSPGRELPIRRGDGSLFVLPLTDTEPSGGSPPLVTYLKVRDGAGALWNLPKNLSGHIPLRRSNGALSQLVVTSDTITVRAASGSTYLLPLVP